MNKTMSSRKFRGGAYATAVSFIVIVVLVIVNLVAGSLFHYRDLTSTGKYSLSEATVKFLKDFNGPVDLYYVTSEGEEDLTIQQSAERIAEACDSINLYYKDPVQYPQFVKQYNGMADITNNSIIVLNRETEKSSYIDSDQMCIYDVDSTSLQLILKGYDAELEIIKGIVAVTQESKGTIYMTTGHKEWEWISGSTEENLGKITETFQDLLSLNAYKVKYCNLLKTGEVPSDCNILFIGGALSDISAEEEAAIERYMTAGGTVIVALMCNTDTFQNLQALLGAYGLRYESGFVCDSDPSRTTGDVVAILLGEHGRQNTVWPYAAPIYKSDLQKKTTTITVLSETSKGGYVRQMNAESLALADGEQTASYPLLVKAEDNFQGVTGTMYVFSTAYFFADNSITGRSSFDNRVQLLECLAGASVEDGTSVLSIPDTLAREEGLVMSTNQKNNVALLSFLFPALILVIGIVVVLRRRIEKVSQ